MRKVLSLVALATFIWCGQVNAAQVAIAVNDTITDNQTTPKRNTKGLGDLLGSFFGGASNKVAQTPDSVAEPQKSESATTGKDAVSGLIGSFLGGAKGGSDEKSEQVGNVLGSIFNGIAGNKLSAESVEGTWNYTGAKCVLKSDDALKKMGSEVMVAPIEKKLNTYLAKVGFKPGSFSYTFNADGSFTSNFGGRPLNGKYVLDIENKTITLTFFGVLKSTMTVTVVNQQLGLLHDADKLLALVRAIAAKSSAASIQSLNKVLSSYDGLQVGMEFEK